MLVRRLLPFLSILLLVAAACGAAVTPAIEVNGDEVSRSDLLDQAAVLAEPLDVGTDTTVSSEFMGQLIVVRINELLIYQAAEELGVEVTDDHRAEATALLEESNANQIEDPEDLANLVEVLAPLVAAQLALEETVDPGGILEAAYPVADITVDPRFGTWDAATASVIPPEGPEPG